jgi:hypothetical protein
MAKSDSIPDKDNDLPVRQDNFNAGITCRGAICVLNDAEIGNPSNEALITATP